MSAISVPTRKRMKRSARAAAVGVLLAAGLVANVGVRQLTRQTAGSEATHPIASPADGMAAVPHVTPAATVYLLVDSTEQASVNRARSTAPDAAAESSEAVVVVAESAAAVARIRQAVENLAAIRDAEGQSPIRLVDRTTAWAAGAAAGGCGLDAQTRAC